MKQITPQETCEFCNGLVEDAVTRVPFHYQRNIIYVDNVPVSSCGKCGEIYVAASVYKQLERIAADRKQIRKSVSFPLADYRTSRTLGTR